MGSPYLFFFKYVFKNYRLDSLKNEDVYSQKVTTNIDQFEKITLKFVKKNNNNKLLRHAQLDNFNYL